jgi:transcriptional regulator with XRE-family HTH domain
MARGEVARQGRFGSVLRELRAAANLTQEELAERSGMSVEAISALERGDRRSPRPSTVEWLAEPLKLGAPWRSWPGG